MSRAYPLVASFAAGCMLSATFLQSRPAFPPAIASLPPATAAIGPVASSVQLSPAAATFAPPVFAQPVETPAQAPAAATPVDPPAPISTGAGAALGPVPLFSVPTRPAAAVPEQNGSPVVTRALRPPPASVTALPPSASPPVAGRVETGSGALGRGVVGLPGFGPTPAVPATLPPNPQIAYGGGQQPAVAGRPFPAAALPTGNGYAPAPLAMAPSGATASTPGLPASLPPGAVALPVPSALDGPRTEWQDMHGMGHVADASTITIGSRIVRLYGIRPPAAADRCQIAGGEAGSCRDMARRRLEARISLSPDLSCRAPADGAPTGRGSICLDGSGTDLAGDLVGAGLAYADGGPQSDYGGAEEVARSIRRGIWSMR